MTNKVRAKFVCKKITQVYDGKQHDFEAVISGEGNEDFTKYTPSGDLSIFITNEAKASSFFEEGSEYYLDFTKSN